VAVDAERGAEVEGAVEVERLRDEDGLADAENFAGAEATVLSTATGIVEHNVRGGHAKAQRGVAHHGRLVVVVEAVIAGQQELADFVAAIKFGGGGDAVVEDGRRAATTPQSRAKDDGDARL